MITSAYPGFPTNEPEVGGIFTVTTEFEPGYGELGAADIEDCLQRHLDPNDNDSGVAVWVKEVEVDTDG